MTTENTKYQGWTNYDTWLLALNLNNDYGLYNMMHEYYMRNFDQDDEITYSDGDDLKEYLEDMFFIEQYNIYQICDTWTIRDWNEINFKEVLESFKPEDVEWE